jgi:hypothetical protein
MAHEHSIRRFRSWYAILLRLYPKPYHESFGEPMEQTFNDLLRERAEEEKGLFGFVIWMFVETFAGLIGENMTVIIMQKKSIIRIALATAVRLLLPLLAMQFTEEGGWDLADFAIAGVLLFGTGLTYELIARKAGHIAHRAAVGIAVVAALLLVWINLAVGIIGNEGNPANLMYIGVLAVGIIGALIARFQPHGMARAMFAAALAQMLVAVIALAAGLGASGPAWPSDVLIATGFFAMLWLGSALLFRRASASGAT